METFVRKQASKIAASLHYSSEQEAVMAYGLLALAQTGVTLVLVLGLGWLLHVPLEALTVCLTGSILRKYSGGAHAATMEGCTAFSVLFCTGAALLASWLATFYDPAGMLAAVLSVYVFATLLIRRYAPMASVHKPIRPPKMKRMRKGSYITLIAYGLVSACFYFFGFTMSPPRSLGISLLIGLSWQVFTITPLGAALLQKQDDQPKSNRKEI